MMRPISDDKSLVGDRSTTDLSKMSMMNQNSNMIDPKMLEPKNKTKFSTKDIVAEDKKGCCRLCLEAFGLYPKTNIENYKNFKNF